MKTNTKVILVGVAALVLAVLLVPPLVERIDSAMDSKWRAALTTEAQYRDMTNAYPVASEMNPDHPTRRLWQERREALLKKGYITTRELRMRHSLAAKGAVWGFFTNFQARFPGVECVVRNYKSDDPLVTVTARKSDLGILGPIERFITQYKPEK